MYLLDTNVVSELRRGRSAHPAVLRWRESVSTGSTYLSIFVLAELTHGIALVRRRDLVQARMLEDWLLRVRMEYKDRILGADIEIAQLWGELNVPDKLPTIDGFIAATALVHGLTVVTRNIADFRRAGVDVLDPFAA